MCIINCLLLTLAGKDDGEQDSEEHDDDDGEADSGKGVPVFAEEEVKAGSGVNGADQGTVGVRVISGGVEATALEVSLDEVPGLVGCIGPLLHQLPLDESRVDVGGNGDGEHGKENQNDNNDVGGKQALGNPPGSDASDKGDDKLQ